MTFSRKPGLRNLIEFELNGISMLISNLLVITGSSVIDWILSSVDFFCYAFRFELTNHLL